MKSIYLLLITFLFSQFSFSQGGAPSCAELQANFEQYQSCATSIPFNNSTNNTSRENFNTTCIQQPFRGPTWFFMRIQNSGNIILQIRQVSNQGAQTDVDFVLWGPFNNMGNICAQLNIANEVDCSWSNSSIENVNIGNAAAGQLYILLVDNYSNVPGQITISQIAGTGSSDCSFLSSVKITDVAGNEITQFNYCQPETKDLVANINISDFPGIASNLRFNYKWFKDDVLIANIENSLSHTNTLTVAETGIYKVQITAYDSTDPDVNLNNLDVSEDEIDLKFFNTPTLNAIPISLEQCDYIAPNNDGFAKINLTQAYSAITNDETGINLSYFLDPALRQRILDPADFTNTVAFNQTIYVTGIYENQSFICNSNVATIELTVKPTSVANYPNMGAVCPELNTSFGYFNFDNQRAAIKSSFFPASDVDITFYANPDDASLEQNELTNASPLPIGISVIYARVETNNNCEGIGIFDVEVLIPPIQNTMATVNICESQTVLLSTKDAEALSGQNASVQVSYFYTFENAQNNSGLINKNIPLNFPVGTTRIFVRLFDTTTQCLSIVNFDIAVFANPALVIQASYSLCGIGTARFDLTSRISSISGNNANYQISFYETQANLNADNPIPNPEDYESGNTLIYIRALDPANFGCSSTATLALNVLDIPGNTTNPEIIQLCDDSGYRQFDLKIRESEMAGTTPVADIEFKYYINLNDAQDHNNHNITDPSTFTNTQISNQTIYVRLNSKINSDSETGEACYRILELELAVRPYPQNNLKILPYKICVDINNNVITPAFINTDLSEDIYEFIWYEGFDALSGNEISTADQSTFSTSQAGNYSIRITNFTNAALCSSVFNFQVQNSFIPFSIAADPVEQISFSSDTIVTAIVAPDSEDFQYMIDENGWQSSPIFKNVSEGIHTLWVRNKYGCGEISTSFVVVDYPRYFTPNNDGYNDTWNIGGRTALNISSVFIFDRYGKLLKNLNINEGGWDGTFNGKPLPADDYWFKIIFMKDGIQSEFKSHFSLKR